MNNYIYKNITKAVRYAVFTSLAFLSMACDNDINLGDGTESGGDGTLYGPFEISIPFEIENEDARSRTDWNAPQEFNNVWVAIFETNGNKKLISMTNTPITPDNGYDPGVAHPNPVLGNAVKLDNIYFSDQNNTHYIVGLVNYDGVLAYTPEHSDTPIPLIDALSEVETWADYIDIAIDASTAENAASQGHPMLAGVFTNGHSNLSVDHSGKPQNNANNSGVAFAIELFDKDKKTPVNPTGAIHLRRLCSHVSVNIGIGNNIEIKDPEIRVYNVPNSVFLLEKTTVTDESKFTRENWLIGPKGERPYTTAASDLYGGYYNSSVLTPGNTISGPSIWGNSGTVSNAAYNDAMTFDGSQIKFGYWHYENKHWGRTSTRQYNDREKRYGTSDTFYSLCPSTADVSNNNATYFVLKANVKDKSTGVEGVAEFLIHEGFCCNADGDNASSLESAARDFCFFRNTNYTYRIQINGINDIVVKVEQGETGATGASGEFINPQTMTYKVPKVRSEREVLLPKGDFIWSLSIDGQPAFGTNPPADSPFATLWNNRASAPTDADLQSWVYQNIKVVKNGAFSRAEEELGLADIGTIDEEELVTIKFPNNTEYKYTLSICGKLYSADHRTKIAYLMEFRGDGTLLDSPVVTMPWAPTEGPVIMGIDDHTVSWAPVEGATSYQITLVKSGTMGGYSVTVPVGGVNRDSDGYETPLKTDENGNLSFRIRYANSKNGMLSFLQDDASTAKITIEVVAMNDKAKSDPGSITKTISNPLWDFNSAEWKAAVSTLKKDESKIANAFASSQSITVNGLTMYTGEGENSNKMTHISYSNGRYGFQPNGTGSEKERGFRFHACAKGKITCWNTANSTNSVSGRYVKVRYVDNDDFTVLTSSVSTTKGCNVFPSLGNEGGAVVIEDVDPTNIDTNDTKPDNVWIYASGDQVFFQMKFTPEDR